MALEQRTLYLVATPIGNLGDVTARALETLREVDWIAAEDTRHTRRLLAHYGIGTRLIAVHAHNEARRAAGLIERLVRGERGALVVDAGTPGISDPGERVVRAAVDAGIAVRAVPGASALVAALSVSALPTAAFTFVGFLPPRPAARRARLGELLGREETIVLYEAPHRVRETLEDLAALAPERPMSACRELTKVHEQVLRGPASAVSAALRPEQERGEWVLVIAGAVRGAARAESAATRPHREPKAAPSTARARFVREQIDSGVTPGDAERRADFVLGSERGPRPRKV